MYVIFAVSMPIAYKLTEQDVPFDPWRITLVTNPDVCNLACPLCFLRQRGRPFGLGEMPWETAEAVLRKYAPRGLREVIPSTMGEPLLYTHFDELIDLCSELGLAVNLTTNGTFPGRPAEDWARRLFPVCRDIKVSLMGIRPGTLERLMPGVRPDAHLENIRRLARVRKVLLEAGSRAGMLTLQVTVTRLSEPELPELLDVAFEAGVTRVRLNRAVFLDCSSPALRRELELPPEVCFAGDSPLPVDGTFVKKPRLGNDGHSGTCPFLGKELWILPDGSVQRCPNPEIRFGTERFNPGTCQKCPLRGNKD